MTETETKKTYAVGETENQSVYSHPYCERDGKLYIERQGKSGPYFEQLCNFTPRIMEEVTFDDGETVRREYRVGGRDEYGVPLPEATIPAAELGRMDGWRTSGRQRFGCPLCLPWKSTYSAP